MRALLVFEVWLV